MKNTEQKKNSITEVVFILDRSGSMSGFESDTVGGFNATLAQQTEGEGEVLVTTVLFSTDMTFLHDRLPAREVSPLTVADYRVGGCTALLDAVGSTVSHIGKIHKYARPEDVPAHTVVIITTDGLENASRLYSKGEVKRMIARQSKRYGWEFIFLGANMDAVETAGEIGIRRERAVDFCQDSEGIAASYGVMARAVASVRRERNPSELDGILETARETHRRKENKK